MNMTGPVRADKLITPVRILTRMAVLSDGHGGESAVVLAGPYHTPGGDRWQVFLSYSWGDKQGHHAIGVRTFDDCEAAGMYALGLATGRAE